MRSDEYHRLSAACVAMATGSSTHSDDKSRWLKLAHTCSALENETAGAHHPPERKVRSDYLTRREGKNPGGWPSSS
jgi:hypothetical protein